MRQSLMLRKTFSSVVARRGYMNYKPEERQHVFQPVTAHGMDSPMRRQLPWVDISKNPDDITELIKADPVKAEFLETPKDYAPATRTPKDSITETVLPFNNDRWLLDAYIDSSGESLRIGKVFQELDSMACVAAYNHCLPAKPMLVTAAVDHVSYEPNSHLGISDLRLAGKVIWAGRSSMEVVVTAGPLRGHFTFVALDRNTQKSMAVNQLTPETHEEQILYKRAESYSKFKRIPKDTLSLPPKVVHSSTATQITTTATRAESTSVMHPQFRNIHHTMIFGGYLLQQTHDLAHACLFSHFPHAKFLSLDNTTFKRPVQVGAILKLVAHAVYAAGDRVVVRVEAECGDKWTGCYVYSFNVGSEVEILPQTEQETEWYNEGYRSMIESDQFYKHGE